MTMGAEPVYQPTTVSVSYEPRPGRNNGKRSIFFRLINTPRFQLILLLFGLAAIPFGIALVIGAVASLPSDFLSKKQTEGLATTEDDEPVVTCIQMPILLIVTGALFIVAGLFSLGVYLTVADWRRQSLCQCPLFDKKKSMARQLQCQNGGGCGEGIMALNPSTDPLVSHTQYAPVSELPHRFDEEERRNLMPDNKDCLSSAEESDRMLEPDPRIVLRPMGRVDDA